MDFSTSYKFLCIFSINEILINKVSLISSNLRSINVLYFQ